MPDFVYTLLLAMGGICIGLIVLAIAFEFLYWAVGALWTVALQTVEGTSRFLIQMTIKVCVFLKRIALSLLRVMWEMLTTAALLVLVPSSSWLGRAVASFRNYMELVRLYLKHGRQEFDSFSEFKRRMLNDEEESTPKSEYEDALEIFGLSRKDAFTLTDLRQRYRDLLSLVHPDKGFPNRMFAQQVNEAFRAIKRERKWS